MEDQLAAAGGGVDLLRQALEANASLPELPDRLDEVRERTPEAIELPDNQGIPAPDVSVVCYLRRWRSSGRPWPTASRRARSSGGGGAFDQARQQRQREDPGSSQPRTWRSVPGQETGHGGGPGWSAAIF